MNREKMQAIGIDYDEGVKRFAGHTNLYEKFVIKFIDDPSYQALIQAMDADDVENAFRAAHTLKGIAGNLSFHCITEPLTPMVEALRTGNLEAAKEKYPALKSEYEKVCACIRASADEG
ncbi:MAG: Hpt domain-containing protein [Lachnospiraceae bacterium]|nr:Hpt domain-containing protein [Lachnospiraceae bacterium]